MAKTYADIVKQIESLKKQADDVRRKEIGDVVKRIREAIAFYGLQPQDLFGPGGRGKRREAPRAAAGAKYGDGTGNVWSGRGPRPHWLRDALAAGRTLEEFALPAASGGGRAPGRRRASRKGAAVKFRDDAGHTWGGRGPRPQWLKDALAAGKSLDDFAA